jgi:hypothetical protein
MALEKLPATRNIPELGINVGGLQRYSTACMFLPEPSLSGEHLRLREWLRHTVSSAARHYRKARELVARQESADQIKSGGVVFYVFDVPEHIENCVAALYRVCAALTRMSAANSFASEFSARFRIAIEELRTFRNQFEHMHGQIVPGQTGPGPIVIGFGDEGKCIRFRTLAMPTERLHGLIEGAFRQVATLYPNFDPDSAPTPDGFTTLQMSMTVRVIEHGGDVVAEPDEPNAL